MTMQGEFRLLAGLLAGMAWRGFSAEAAISRTAEAGEDLAPMLASQLNPAAGPKASFFRIMARAMWNQLPQPGEDFRVIKLPEPGRNDPCFCGSLRKHKQCCARMPEFPIASTLMLEALLEVMPRTRWQDLAGSAIDRRLLAYMVFGWQQDGQHKEIAALLEPWFKGEGEIRDKDTELLDLLLEAYVSLNKPRKRRALAKAAIARGGKVARSVGWQRIALMEADDGNDGAASRALAEAMRADPDNLNLGILEVHLLASAGKLEQARDRARYWALRLEKLNDPELGEQIAWMRTVAQNPQAAFMEIAREMNDGAVEKFETLLESAPPVACHYDLAPQDGGTGPFMPDKALAQALGEWRNVFPSNPPSLTWVTTWNEEPWQDLRWLDALQRQPLLWQSFEVVDDLACALDGHDAPWVAEKLVPALTARARALFERVLEKHHARDLRCEWGWRENRPALRMLARTVLAREELQDAEAREDAFELMRRFVEVLNPEDNHGFRAQVVAGLIERDRAGEALALAGRYPDDGPDMMLTHALALHAAGREDEAIRMAKDVEEQYPRVIKLLLDESPRRPRSLDPAGYSPGSAEEAWIYRDNFRKVWEKTGALPWLFGLAGGDA